MRRVSVIQLFAVTAEGPVPLSVRAGITSAHELFDGLPLGVYSALRTFQHERFLGLELHFERTDRSLALLGRPERLDRPLLARAIDQCVRAYPGPDAFVRFDVLAEPAHALGRAERTLLALSPLPVVPAACLREGVTVRISPLVRTNPLVKVASFVVARRPYPLGHQQAYEHLIVDAEGRILEGTSSNFVAVQGKRLRLTGALALQGVTQRIVSELAHGLGLESVNAPLAPAELAQIDEAFLTGSTRGLVPIVAVEEQRIGSGRPGPWTARLTDAYYAHARTHARRAVE
jgi:branched-subunit amino acid aminotransferase/4-amino-4-deoxychorismate lyase